MEHLEENNQNHENKTTKSPKIQKTKSPRIKITTETQSEKEIYPADSETSSPNFDSTDSSPQLPQKHQHHHHHQRNKRKSVSPRRYNKNHSAETVHLESSTSKNKLRSSSLNSNIEPIWGPLYKRSKSIMREWKLYTFYADPNDHILRFNQGNHLAQAEEYIINLKALQSWKCNGKLVPINYSERRGFSLCYFSDKKNRVKVLHLLAENQMEYDKWANFLSHYMDKHFPERYGLLLNVHSATYVPSKRLSIIVDTGDRRFYTRYVSSDDNISIWRERFFIEDINLDQTVTFKLKTIDEYSHCIGEAHVKVKDLVKSSRHFIIMNVPSSYEDPMTNSFGEVTELRVGISNEKFPLDWHQYRVSEEITYEKHIMMITRGTQGDVQPFVALARGLAISTGWLISICTESSFKDFVDSHSDVPNGHIQFLSSGGNTGTSISSPISKWAIRNKSTVMQAAMVAFSEAEFYSSEPVIYHWANKLRPDVIVYSFTTASIAMILSERLNIPMVGFIFQPTVIPSSQYEAVVPISSSILDKAITSHEAQEKLKYIMDQQLTTLRTRRGLKPLKEGVWKVIIRKNMPLVIPIHEACFGGKPLEWHTHASFTNFMFLRSSNSELSDEVTEFIQEAKKEGRPLIAIGFSSMPVSRSRIYKILNLIADCVNYQPSIIAIMGSSHSLDAKKTYQEKIDHLKSTKRLLEVKSAPFCQLFPQMDCLIIHGGLGTISEAIRAGVPVIVTGVLLMDQRFWGKRVKELGIGPEPVHISDFTHVCIDFVNEALKPNSSWAKNAKLLADKIRGETEDNIDENVQMFLNYFKISKPITYDDLLDEDWS